MLLITDHDSRNEYTIQYDYHTDSDNQQQSCQSDCSSQSDAASCKPSSLLFSYYTSRVYPALRYTPCRAGFSTVRFAFAKVLSSVYRTKDFFTCTTKNHAKFYKETKKAQIVAFTYTGLSTASER